VKRQFTSMLALSVLLVVPSFSVAAHHSMSMYDQTRSITLKATVSNFAWTNPHVEIQFQTQDEKGPLSPWVAECPSPSRLSRAGWSEDTIKPGDQVTIVGNPAKDGSNQMRLGEVILPNGQEMTAYRS
jgi:hypothetical protein